jgi:ABC-type multidrug transport system fused ATPase/permease subunit
LENQKLDIANPAQGLKVKAIAGQIEFKDVTFTYKGSNLKALNKVNLKISSGCVTALVGPSGGGKTTVARLIYRHYDPEGGLVLLDNKDLRS